jgi:hypothetical protein
MTPVSGFEERSMIYQSDGVLNKIYCRAEDGVLFVVKSNSLPDWIDKSKLENEVEKLINVRHPCISAQIGFVFPMESGSSGELQTVRLHVEFSSLAEVISSHPVWWTATAKAKAIVGLVLALRFLHSLGLFHHNLNSRNIYFDLDHHIQIGYFDLIDVEVDDDNMGGFSSAECTMQMDVRGFASIFFEVVVDQPANAETSIPLNIPDFVSKIIEGRLWSESKMQCPFCNIFRILKENAFRIVEGVDSAEILAFVKWVESTANPGK